MALVERIPGSLARVDSATSAARSRRRRERTASRLLEGRAVPSLALPFALDAEVSLDELASAYPLVVCLFQAIGWGGRFDREADRIIEWQHCRRELVASGHRLIAISSESFFTQARSADLMGDWMVLSDVDLDLARALPVTTIEDGLTQAFEPATLLVEEGRIRRFFPAVDTSDAETVTDWIRRRASIGLAPAPQAPPL